MTTRVRQLRHKDQTRMKSVKQLICYENSILPYRLGIIGVEEETKVEKCSMKSLKNVQNVEDECTL